jgi:ribosomal protein S18 acetylase RimI-like enzyme
MNALSFIVRDGLEADIADCLQIDHAYDTDYIWQVTFSHLPAGHQVTLRQERLPRGVTLTHPVSLRRLEIAAANHQLLLAVERESSQLLAYAVVRHDPYNGITTVCDLVVDRFARRRGLGSRFFTVLRRWAAAHEARFMACEVPHKNYPAIQFCLRQGLEFSGINDKYFSDYEVALFFTQLI